MTMVSKKKKKKEENLSGLQETKLSVLDAYFAVSPPAGRVYSRGSSQRGPVWQTVKEEKVTDCLYMCPVCNMLFSQAKCLTVHLKKAHQIECNEGGCLFFLTSSSKLCKLVHSSRVMKIAISE